MCCQVLPCAWEPHQLRGSQLQECTACCQPHTDKTLLWQQHTCTAGAVILVSRGACSWKNAALPARFPRSMGRWENTAAAASLVRYRDHSRDSRENAATDASPTPDGACSTSSVLPTVYHASSTPCCKSSI